MFPIGLNKYLYMYMRLNQGKDYAHLQKETF